MTKCALILFLLLLPVLSMAECEKTITHQDKVKDVQRKLDCFSAENADLKREMQKLRESSAQVSAENADLKREMQKLRESSAQVRGEDLRFRLVPLWSKKLHEREDPSNDSAWDSACTGVAADSLNRIGFKIVRSTSNTMRGQQNNLHIIVECRSVHGYAYIYGFSPTTEFERFNELVKDLSNRMENLMPEFK